MNWDSLFKAARDARKLAYAPYSRFKVGAALLDSQGRVWAGCNVENASYGLSICAERTAITKMVSAGSHKWRAIALAAKDGCTPCGACLQVLSEFATSEAEVAFHDQNGIVLVKPLTDFLPLAFRLPS
jgi:cytidine deaminase